MMNFKNVFTSDSDRDPAFIRLVRITLWTSMFGALAIAVMLFLLEQNPRSIFGILFIGLLSAVSLFFSYHNILWVGKAVFPLTILTMVIFLSINSNGIHDSSMVGFTMVIIFASLFSGQKVIPLATFFTVLGICIVAYADMTGINKSPLANKTGWDDIAIMGIIQIVVAVALNELLSRLNFALDTTRASEQAQVKSNQSLRELQVHLEQRIVERTAAAENARAQSESARINLEAQIWLANGQTQLADAIRGEQDVSQLAENVLSRMCPYIEAQSGALFLLNGKKLELAGVYAYTARPGFDGTIALGEGLVGQAAADGKVIRTMLPPDTLFISTGLGDIPPREIVAAPFYMNDKVVGVLELATLFTFTERHLEFWNRVSETLGYAFHTVLTRQRLSALLAESQQQAEELQAQEEELRAANEELQAQAENLFTKNGRAG